MIIIAVAASILTIIITWVFGSLYSQSGARERHLAGIFFAGLAILAVIWTCYFGWYSRPEQVAARQDAADPCQDRIGAYIMAQHIIRQRLLAPATADFPTLNRRDVISVPTHGCRFLIDAYVDSQNAFGAQVRTAFSMTLQLDTKRHKWRMEKLDL